MGLFMKLPKFQINSTLLAFLLAVHFTFFLNLALFKDVREVFTHLPDYNILFALSIPITFIAAFNIFFLPFTVKYVEKSFFIILLISAAMVDFAMFNYGIIFDQNMIENFAQTNFAETQSYTNSVVFSWVGLTGVLPALLLLFTKVKHSGVLKDVVYKGASLLGSIAVILFLAMFFYKDYASVIRNNSNLRKEVVPYYYINSTIKYVNNTYFYEPIEFTHIGMDAKKLPKEKPDLLVVIVGETARAMNYGLNGYGRDTNKYSKNIENITSFQNVSSCGTATAVSLPCMFSMLDKKDYSSRKFKNQDNVVDILRRADVSTHWIDNNTGSKGVAARTKYTSIDKRKSEFCDGLVCTDDYFIKNLQDKISRAKWDDNVIFLHVMGSHGPTYYKRYPKEYKEFKPECARSDIQNCGDQEIVNTYDNTILFTDYVMANVIKILEKNSNQYNASMIYISDHGESLGENGLYLHGMPYAVAPDEQTHVPMITWFSDETIKAKKINQTCLNKLAKNEKYSHDNLSHTILGLMGVQTSVYKPYMDVLHTCRRV